MIIKEFSYDKAINEALEAEGISITVHVDYTTGYHEVKVDTEKHDEALVDKMLEKIKEKLL